MISNNLIEAIVFTMFGVVVTFLGSTGFINIETIVVGVLMTIAGIIFIILSVKSTNK